MRNFGGLDKGALNPKIVQGLIHVLDEHNGIVRLFRTARDRCNAGEIPGFKIRLYNMGGVRGYELPTSDILGGIVFESGPRSRTDFDVIIEVRERPPQRTNKLHQSYMSLQFPLGDHEGITVGSKFMLPNTFTRGPRYKNELQDAPQIDEYISAEIPDPVEDARGYKLVIELIMHGPYGAAKLGPDRILSKISNSEASTSAPGNRKQIDEIQNYVDGLFICIYEACWRIFDFPIHSREPAVQILSVYLENMQHVTFRERDRLDSIVNLPKKKRQALSNNLSKLWTKHWQAIRDDIPTKISKATGILRCHVKTAELQGYILYELKAILNGFGKSVKDFGLSDPLQHLHKDLENKLLMEEK
ncbi:hypothetical protein Tco_0789213 [Tanacetum coccineum]